ncbi:hypothetical protein pEaSNUABM25_00092 [Erwinia phage pEa_SNUABM_25]|nr:hypothetical protein pEaSNUABM25_00092 [Erwinia phage pEa_SNUABM_25]
MKYSLFAASAVPQLTRLFAQATADDKSCYLVRLNNGFTETDINKCLNYQTQTGAGYSFDAALAASSGICTVLAKGTNCVRTIDRQKISVSDCLLTAVAEGVPTHLILGGILPVCLTVGTDVTLLYPDLNIKYDAAGYKTQITINSFTIPLTNMWVENTTATWLGGSEVVALDSSLWTPGATSFADYLGATATVSGNAKAPADGAAGIDLGTTGVMSLTSNIDLSQSFTIEFDYRQSSTTDYSEFTLLKMGTTLTDRLTLSFDRSNEKGFLLWNNSGGGAAAAKVVRPIAAYAAMKTASNVHIKYVYNALSNIHTISINGTVVDSFTYAIVKPNVTGSIVTGGYGSSANAAYTPIIDKYSIRQGV